MLARAGPRYNEFIRGVGNRIMSSITGHYDGTAIIPDVPLDLARGQRVRVQIEAVDENDYPLTRIGKLATDMGVADLAQNHDRYARQRPEEQ